MKLGDISFSKYICLSLWYGQLTKCKRFVPKFEVEDYYKNNNKKISMTKVQIIFILIW